MKNSIEFYKGALSVLSIENKAVHNLLSDALMDLESATDDLISANGKLREQEIAVKMADEVTIRDFESGKWAGKGRQVEVMNKDCKEWLRHRQELHSKIGVMWNEKGQLVVDPDWKDPEEE